MKLKVENDCIIDEINRNKIAYEIHNKITPTIIELNKQEIKELKEWYDNSIQGLVVPWEERSHVCGMKIVLV